MVKHILAFVAAELVPTKPSTGTIHAKPKKTPATLLSHTSKPGLQLRLVKVVKKLRDLEIPGRTLLGGLGFKKFRVMFLAKRRSLNAERV